MANRLRIHRYLSFLFFCFLPAAFTFAGGQPETPRAAETNTPPPEDEEQETPGLNADEPRQPPEILAADRWGLDYVPFDTEILRNVVNERMEDGFAPVGVHVVPGESFAVLFARTGVLDRNWGLVDIEFDAMNTEFSALLDDGYAPIDISLGNGSVYVLFTPAQTSFLSWRIVQVEVDSAPSMEAAVEDMAEVAVEQAKDARHIYGLDYFDGRMYLLFVEADTPPVGDRIVFRAFPNDGTSSLVGIDREVLAGSLPAGLGITPDWVVVPFYQ